MSGIVCAIRGGPGSRATTAEAVTLAQKTDLPVHFLYVVNLDFLTRTATSRISVISEEMRRMGESILSVAQDHAVAQGVPAQGVIRHGAVGEEIASLCHELKAQYLVLGRPQPDKADNVFTQARLAQFIKRLEAETGAQVVLPKGVRP
jgi:nucleotide-binding universal stress UspA family protein